MNGDRYIQYFKTNPVSSFNFLIINSSSWHTSCVRWSDSKGDRLSVVNRILSSHLDPRRKDASEKKGNHGPSKFFRHSFILLGMSNTIRTKCILGAYYAIFCIELGFSTRLERVRGRLLFKMRTIPVARRAFHEWFSCFCRWQLAFSLL